jgi:quercetin dioxygenase-like cupin family protein
MKVVAALGLALVLAAAISSSIGDAHTRQTHGLLAQAAPGPVGLRATTILQTTTTAIGQPIQFPLFRNQWTAVILEIAPGGRVGRHLHPVPNLVYVLEGEITIESDGHAVRTYRQGEAFAESFNHWHDGLNRGTTPIKVLVVFAGEEGKPVTVRP